MTGGDRGGDGFLRDLFIDPVRAVRGGDGFLRELFIDPVRALRGGCIWGLIQDCDNGAVRGEDGGSGPFGADVFGV